MKKVALIVFIFMIVKTYCQQTKFYLDKKKSFITYTMHHPLHDWNGICKDFNSVLVADSQKNNISQIAVSAKLSNFDSKNANRDSHMIEVAEGLKFPNVTFTSSEIERNGNKLNIKGKVNFHGVSKNINFEANQRNFEGKVEILGSFTIKMSQFNITPPSLMGMQTDDEFKIDFVATY